ncbi:MAG: hypothetical protein AB7S41_11305 [Parvibaculaceae bacterium]
MNSYWQRLRAGAASVDWLWFSCQVSLQVALMCWLLGFEDATEIFGWAIGMFCGALAMFSAIRDPKQEQR